MTRSKDQAQQKELEMSNQKRSEQQHQDKNKEMARSKDQGLHTKREDDPDNE